MNKQVDHVAAWKDFFSWIKQQEKWKDIPRKGRYGKLYLYKTSANIEKTGKDGKPMVGPINVQNILEHHAPHRYEVRTRFIIHGKPMPVDKKEL